MELRLLVWTSRAEWAELWQKWSDTPFVQLDFTSLESTTAAFQKKLARMDKGLPSNQVCAFCCLDYPLALQRCFAFPFALNLLAQEAHILYYNTYRKPCLYAVLYVLATIAQTFF